MIKEIRLLAPDPKDYHIAWEVAKSFTYLPADQSEIFIPLAHYRNLRCKVHAANGILSVVLTEKHKGA